MEPPFSILTPEDVPRAFVEAWNTRRPDQLAALFEEEAEFVNVVGLWWHTREAIYKAHEYGLRVIFNDSKVELRRTKVMPLAEDIAVVHARMKLTGQSAHGGVENPGDRFNVFSFVVRRQQDQWRCVSAHNTDVVPGAETNIVKADGQMGHADYRDSDGGNSSG